MTETTGRKRARRPTQPFVTEESEQDGDVSAGSEMVGGFGTVPGESESEGGAQRKNKKGAQKCRTDEDEVAASAQATRVAKEAQKPFLCSEDGCVKRFANQKNLLEHSKNKHAVAVQAARASREANKPFLFLCS
jgi:hypothetical protein